MKDYQTVHDKKCIFYCSATDKSVHLDILFSANAAKSVDVLGSSVSKATRKGSDLTTKVHEQTETKYLLV